MKVPKKVWVSVLVVIGLALVVTAALVFRHHSQQVAEKRRITEQTIKSAQKLETSSDKEGRLTYYTNLGGAYYNAEEYDKALDSFLKADERITDRSVNGSSVNLLIAATYTKLGDKDQAREYYERELKRIKGSNNEKIEKNIRDLQDRL